MQNSQERATEASSQRNRVGMVVIPTPDPPLHQPKNVGCAVGCDLPGTLLDPTAEGDRGLKGLQKSATEDLGKGVGNNP